MYPRSLHLLKGIHFNIELELNPDGEFPSTLMVSKALITRHKRAYNIAQNNIGNDFLKKISQNMGFDIKYLQLDFDKIHFLSSKVDGHSRDITEQSFNKYKVKGQSLPLNYLMRFFPALNQESFIDNNKFQFLVDLLDQFELGLSRNEIIVFSGEMIWSRFIDFGELYNLILRLLEGKHSYILIDYYGIWQSLVNKDFRKLKSLNKRYFLPNLLEIEVSKAEEVVEINKDKSKKLLIINDDNLFNLKDGPYYLNDMLIPKWFLVRKNRSKDKKHKFVHIGQDISRDFPAVFDHYPQNEFHTSFQRLSFNEGLQVSCSKKVADWVDANETIGGYQANQISFHKVPNRAKLSVFNGQIVKKGDKLFSDVWGKSEFATLQAEVDLKYLDKGLIGLISSKKQMELKSPLEGEVIGFSVKDGISMRISECIVYPMDFFSGKAITGIISDSLGNGNLYYCQDFKTFNQIIKLEKWWESAYLKKGLSGVLIGSLSLKELSLIEASDLRDFNMGIFDISLGKSTYDLPSNLIGKHAVLSNEGLIVAIDETYKQESNNNHSMIGKSVKAVDLGRQLIYGKILSKSNRNSDSVLVDIGNGYSECLLSNIILT